MIEYNLEAVVSRQYVDDIVMKIEARTKTEALAKAERALHVFPNEPGHEESGIPIMYVKRRHQDHLEIIDIREDGDGHARDI